MLVAVSTLYRTPAVDGRGPAFINGVAHIRSRLDRPALLAGLADIEAVLGRQRSGDRLVSQLNPLLDGPLREVRLAQVG